MQRKDLQTQLCLPKDVKVLTPNPCKCDLIWKWVFVEIKLRRGN
jgi:hypothetical protein